MTFKRVKITETVYVNTGGLPGSSTTSDSIALYAKVNLGTETNATPTDSLGFYARVTLPDTAPAQSDAVNLYAKVNLTDTAPPQSDLLNDINLGLADVNAAPTDAITALALAGIMETNPAPADTVKAGFAGPALRDTSNAPSDGFSTVVTTWATTQSTSGQAPTNPTNALGQANGTTASVKGAGGVLSGTNSVMTLNIPVASIPAVGAKTLLIYAQLTTAASGSTVTYTNTGGSPASGTVDFGGALGAGDNALTTPKSIALTTVGTALSLTFTGVGGLLGISAEYLVDAVGVRTVAPF